jgi:hypothetical protein
MTRSPRPLGAAAALVLATLALLPRCACDTVPADALERCEASQVVPGAVATDILFVIDDSGSMSQEQATLQAGLDAFIQTLASSPVANDFQVGVTTTSVADFDGTANPNAGVLVPPGIMPSSSPSLVADFQSAVVVGTGGFGREQGFEAARQAIEKSGPGGANEGFIRPGARLAVIVLSDEDDCSGPTDASIPDSAGCRTAKASTSSSLLSVDAMAAYLGGNLVGERRDVVVAAVVGVAPGTLVPSCGPAYCSDNTCSTAMDAGERYVQLLAAVGAARTRLASICDATFDQALAGFADAIMSKTLPLDGAPGDWRMLVASLERPGVGTIPCKIARYDDPPATKDLADAIYEPPLSGRPASLTFQRSCALQQGDRVDVRVICAG